MDGDPLADVNVVIDKVRWVMKGGAVVVDKARSDGSDGAGGSGRRAGRRLVGVGADAIKALVERFLLHLGDHEVRQGRRRSRAEGDRDLARQADGQWVRTAEQTGDEWIAAMKKNPNPTIFREPSATSR